MPTLNSRSKSNTIRSSFSGKSLQRIFTQTKMDLLIVKSSWKISQKTNYGKKELPRSPVIERCNVKQIVIKGDRHNESHRSSSLEIIGISVVRGKHHKYWTKCDYKAAPRHQDNNLSFVDRRVEEPSFCSRACMERFSWVNPNISKNSTFETWPTQKFSSWFSWYFCPTRLTWEYPNLEYSEFSYVV